LKHTKHRYQRQQSLCVVEVVVSSIAEFYGSIELPW